MTKRAAKLGLLASASVGLAAILWLLASHDLEAVGEGVAAVGWSGLLALGLCRMVPVPAAGLAWQVLVPGSNGFWTFCWARWLRESIGTLLLPVGGEVAGARELTLRGVPGGLAAASTIVDITNEALSQVAFTLLGLGLLTWVQPDRDIARWGLIGVAVSIPLIAGFMLAQRAGMFKPVERMVDMLAGGPAWKGMAEGQGIHAGIEALYARPKTLALGSFLHLVAWVLSTLDGWVALYLMGRPLSLVAVVALESLVSALRSAAFAIPWAAGVQEGGYIVLGAAFGLSPETALSLSLLKRGRDLLAGVPPLVVWQFIEGGRLWKRWR